jgi:hypothetical protein
MYELDPDEEFHEQGDESPDDKELSQLIDEWLASERPERYDSTDKEWMSAVIVKARDALKARREDDDVIAESARRLVHQREGQATKRANRVLRNISRTGQLPLDWGQGDNWRMLLFETLSLPLAIDKKRVRFGAASASDLDQWELENAREEDKRKLAQIESRRGAKLLADWVRSQGAGRVEDLRRRDINDHGGPVA